MNDTAEAPVAIVTGGSSGIGQAVAVALAQDGWRVAVVGRSLERLTQSLDLIRSASAELGQPSEPLALPFNVADEADMQAMAERTLAAFGRIDLLVASAGLGKRADTKRVMPHPTAELPLSEWEEVINVNLRGIFLSNRAVLPTMRAQGRGQIINVGSSTTPQGLRGTPFGPAYCASKFGMVGLTEVIAGEEERHGIRAQVIFPGPVETPLVDQTILARPFGGAVKAEHFADAVVFMARHPVDGVLVHPHLLPFRGYFEQTGDAPPSAPATRQ
ncbi:MAG: SDR family oxidoreductase [Pseudomonadota bacterium]